MSYLIEIIDNLWKRSSATMSEPGPLILTAPQKPPPEANTSLFNIGAYRFSAVILDKKRGCRYIHVKTPDDRTLLFTLGKIEGILLNILGYEDCTGELTGPFIPAKLGKKMCREIIAYLLRTERTY